MRTIKPYHFKRRTIRRFTIFIFFIVFLMSFFSLNATFSEIFDNSNNESSIVKEQNREYIPISSDYTMVDPININSPDDWTNYPFINGTGSAIDPYIIENVEIQGTGVKTKEEYGHSYLNYSDGGIYINAAGNFTIRNCKVSSISYGIYLGVGVSTGYVHSIYDVEIHNCGIGIYVFGHGGGGHIAVNISRCTISNCNWVTVKVPYELDSIFYGGFGMWVRGDEGSIIEFCHIQNCSIGLLAGPAVSLISNQLINCGFLFDFTIIYVYDLLFNNTINGKQLGLFRAEDDLSMSGQEASQYGQLIFAGCHNLHLSDFDIKKSCSFGLILHYCNNPVLKNIVCENQQIGFLIYSDYMKADNLNVKNCNAGFCFLNLRNSKLTHITINNTHIPVYGTNLMNTKIAIKNSTRFYLIDHYGIDEIQVNSSASSIMVPRLNITELGTEGFMIPLDEIDTYHINGFDPVHQITIYDFIIVIFRSSKVLVIPGFPLIWYYIAILLGITFSKFLMRYKKR
jgi:hypothetical protein